MLNTKVVFLSAGILWSPCEAGTFSVHPAADCFLQTYTPQTYTHTLTCMYVLYTHTHKKGSVSFYVSYCSLCSGWTAIGTRGISVHQIKSMICIQTAILFTAKVLCEFRTLPTVRPPQLKCHPEKSHIHIRTACNWIMT